MKPLYLLFALISAAPTLANAKVIDGNEMVPYCQNNLTYSSDKDLCVQAVLDNRFESETLAICTSLTYSSDKLQCLRLIANQKLEPAFLQFCQSKSYSSDKIACAKTYLKPLVAIPAPDTCSLYEQRTVSRAKVALEDLERGDIEHAKEMLRRILAQ
jgi:hypothetical protein